MPGPADPNDPNFANNPDYAFINGKWVPKVGTAAYGPTQVQGSSQGGNPFSAGVPAGGIQTGIPIQNANTWQTLAQQGANAAPRANPYSMVVANQTLPAQQQLFQQMRAQQAGPSIANMQAQGAQGNNLQAALRARGGNAAVAQQAGGVANTISNEAATARLAEQLAGSAQQGGLSSGMRNRAQQAEQQSVESALKARALDDAARRFYSSQGSNFGAAQEQAKLDQYKSGQKIKLSQAKSDQDFAMGLLKMFGTIFGAGG